MTQSALVVAQNADIRYLGKLLGDVIRQFGGDALFRRIEYIRAASVDRYRGVPPFRETRSYVVRVLSYLRRFQKKQG